MAEESPQKVFAGCFFCLWVMGVVYPLYYAMMFGVLQQIDAPPWVWVAFWLYVPASLIGTLIKQILNHFHLS